MISRFDGVARRLVPELLAQISIASSISPTCGPALGGWKSDERLFEAGSPCFAELRTEIEIVAGPVMRRALVAHGLAMLHGHATIGDCGGYIPHTRAYARVRNVLSGVLFLGPGAPLVIQRPQGAAFEDELIEPTASLMVIFPATWFRHYVGDHRKPPTTVSFDLRLR